MFKHNSYKDIAAIKEWLGGIELTNPYAITLPCKDIKGYDISQQFRYFTNRLNQIYLKNAYTRNNKTLKIIPIIEGDNVISKHYHLIVDNPHSNREEEFIKSIKRAWYKTHIHKNKIDIKRMRDNGWLNYILKRRTKVNVMDSLDITNLSI